MPLGFRLHPGGTLENSPTLQRWVEAPKRARPGPAESAKRQSVFSRPFVTWYHRRQVPNAKELGYCRTSLWDEDLTRLPILNPGGMQHSCPQQRAFRTTKQIGPHCPSQVAADKNGPSPLRRYVVSVRTGQRPSWRPDLLHFISVIVLFPLLLLTACDVLAGNLPPDVLAELSGYNVVWTTPSTNA